MTFDPTPIPRWLCGAFQPDPPPGRLPYRCTEPYNHPGDHQAAVDGEVVAQWPRPVPTTPAAGEPS